MRKPILHMRIVTLTWLMPTAVFPAEEPTEADLFGDWVFLENLSVIRFYRCGESMCGKIVRVADPSRRDVHNPDPRLRNRPSLALSTIEERNALFNQFMEWWEGRP